MMHFIGIVGLTVSCLALLFLVLLKVIDKIDKIDKKVSLQEAAKILAKSDFIKYLKPSLIEHSAPINPSDPISDLFWERANPDKIHKKIMGYQLLPKETIGLINLTLHICRKNNVKVYGKRPSFSKDSIIDFEEIEYFSADYTELFSDRARLSNSLIYSKVSISKKDFKDALTKVNETSAEQQQLLEVAFSPMKWPIVVDEKALKGA